MKVGLMAAMAATPLSPDIGILARPGPESFQLTLWLAHPGVEEIELAKRLCTDSRVAVNWVISKKYKVGHGRKVERFAVEWKNRGQPLVMFHKTDDIVFP